MSEFKRYQHVERFGTDDVEGVEIGLCYIFPKIDGTNGSVWLENGEIRAGSRNRQLSLENDNQEFLANIVKDDKIIRYLEKYPDRRLFGEWLVPHSLKTYRQEAWRKFYIFDVAVSAQNVEGGLEYLAYDLYKDSLDEVGLEYIPCQTLIKNPSYEQLIYQAKNNFFLVEDGKGFGEGIVIKNYDFRNKYGKQTFAKIVTNEFKEKHSREMGNGEIRGAKMTEEYIVEEFCTDALIEKTYAKIVNECEGWRSEYIPRLLNTVYHDLVTEECWNFVKKFKYPSVNFRTLSTLVTIRIKEVKKDLF